MQRASYYRYIPGLFDLDSRKDLDLPRVLPRFGLIDDSPERWEKFQAQIDHLQAGADKNNSVKVFLFVRHDDLAKEKYGNEAWDRFWSLIEGDTELIWGHDPSLTLTGRSQAELIREALEVERLSGMPFPQRLYCSPLRRAMETSQIIFGSSPSSSQGTWRPTIIDRCRRIRGGHTCDLRRSHSEILSSFPSAAVEPDFTEHDELWHPGGVDTPETVAEQAQAILDSIFRDPATYISVTAHGRIIAGFLRSLGISPGVLPTGGIYPVVVEAVNSASS
ncbi:histidine phosphatase superfamily [Mycena crocata]|nr:histidine phosphatase superfamily [Mycena crocata]